MIKYNLQFFGGRGSASIRNGASEISLNEEVNKEKGKVVSRNRLKALALGALKDEDYLIERITIDDVELMERVERDGKDYGIVKILATFKDDNGEDKKFTNRTVIDLTDNRRSK